MIEASEFRSDSTHVHSTREKSVTLEELESEKEKYLKKNPKAAIPVSLDRNLKTPPSAQDLDFADYIYGRFE